MSRRWRAILIVLVPVLVVALVGVLVYEATRPARPRPSAQATATPAPTASAALRPGQPTPTQGRIDRPTILRTVVGDDWSLPAGISPAPHSGLYTIGQSKLNDVVTIQAPMLSWADLQTGPGQYDWRKLDEFLAESPVVLRLKCGAPDQVPQFLQQQHPNWSSFAAHKGETELPQWSPGWLDAWQPFIQALGARYKDDPRFMGLQLQLTASGEPGMSGTDILEFERRGFSPDVLRDFLARYQGSALDAFQGAEWKVFTVAIPDFIKTQNYRGAYSKEAYARAVRDATLPLFARGLGIRGSGLTEDFTQTPSWPEWAQFQNGLLVVHDDTFPPLRNHGHIDGQPEEWLGEKTAVKDRDKLAYGIRMSLLFALAEEHSFLWVQPEYADYVGAQFMKYVQLELGKQPAEAPDAFLVLGEWSGVQAWPRWLTPVDLSETGDGQAVDTTGLRFVSGVQHLGRVLTGPLGLRVDDRFMPPGQRRDVDVVVEYLDTDAQWHVEYDGVKGSARSPEVSGQGSGQWKTVTIRLPDATFAGHLDGGADLRIIPDKGSPTVQVVRVVRVP